LVQKVWQSRLGLGITLLLLSFLVFQMDFGDVKEAIVQANYLYLIPAIAIYFIAAYLRAVRWRYVLEPMIILPAIRLYPVVIIGHMANNLLPARLGELVRSYELARREGVSASSTLATVAIERLYDGLTLGVFAIFAALILMSQGEFDGIDIGSQTVWIYLAVITAALLVGTLGVLTALSTPRYAEWFATHVVMMLPVRLRPRLLQVVRGFLQGLTILSSPRRQIVLLLFSVPVWLLEGSTLFLVSYSFGIDEYFGSISVLILVMMLVTSTTNLATAIPSSIGGIGPFEVAGQQTLIALGVGASIAGIYVAFVHLVALWLPINIVGVALLWKQNVSLKQIAGARSYLSIKQ